MIIALILVPLIAGVATFFLKRPWMSRTILITSAVIHFSIVALCWNYNAEPALNGWLNLDSLGLLFLSISTVLFLLASIYRVGSTGIEKQKKDFEEGFIFTSTPEAVFCACMLFFLSTMTLVCVSAQSGVMWIAIEASTLASAPLIYFHRHKRSLEAAWKYLLICSVGIALALLGNFFLALAAFSGAENQSLVFSTLVAQASAGVMSLVWLKAAFILLLVGYGTKMGLAPLHTWLPDAHSESPSSVSALLSGALLNCSFLGILRSYQVVSAAGEKEFAGGLLIFFGLVSMAVAGIFILKQKDYKRMLAYSSVEHMGILSLGVGIGGSAVFGAMLHAIGHSFTKGMLFLTAGNILTAYRTKDSTVVKGLLRTVPFTGTLWMLGFFAITGSPPFSTFLSEFTILYSAVVQGKYFVSGAYLAFLALIFVGMIIIFLRMSQGKEEPSLVDIKKGEMLFAVLPPAILIAIVMCLGVWVPSWLNSVLRESAALLGCL